MPMTKKTPLAKDVGLKYKYIARYTITGSALLYENTAHDKAVLKPQAMWPTISYTINHISRM